MYDVQYIVHIQKNIKKTYTQHVFFYMFVRLKSKIVPDSRPDFWKGAVRMIAGVPRKLQTDNELDLEASEPARV